MQNKHSHITLILAAVLILSIAVVTTVGLLQPEPQPPIQGQAETVDYRISGKIPARVARIYVREGDHVRRNDTLIALSAPDLTARYAQALAAFRVLEAAENKTFRGTRDELIQASYHLWQEAQAALTLRKQTLDRMLRLHAEGVITTQQRDEAQAAHDSAEAAERAARASYDQARNGNWEEDRREAAHDPGILIFCLFVPLAYPLLYSYVYTNEVVREVPADVALTHHCSGMSEAQTLFLGVGMATGRRRERYPRGLFPEGFGMVSPLLMVLGRGLLYLMVYLPLGVYALSLHPRHEHLRPYRQHGCYPLPSFRCLPRPAPPVCFLLPLSLPRF